MNRVIKFRAWDGRQVWHPHPHNDAYIAASVFPKVDVVGQARPSTERVAMQFTGLTDKNGKEIYEGDILDLCMEGNTALAVVSWDEKLTQFTTLPGKGTTLFGVELTEVIGNIYEHPNLLSV